MAAFGTRALEFDVDSVFKGLDFARVPVQTTRQHPSEVLRNQEGAVGLFGDFDVPAAEQRPFQQVVEFVGRPIHAGRSSLVVVVDEVAEVDPGFGRTNVAQVVPYPALAKKCEVGLGQRFEVGPRPTVGIESDLKRHAPRKQVPKGVEGSAQWMHFEVLELCDP